MRKYYYESPLMRSFFATVTGCTPCPQGFAVTLDATAFYPEGGGQAGDTGTLGSAQVLDTREIGEEVVHICDAELPVGSRVEGVLNWAHRFDLMQQHTGEHILSGLIHSSFGGSNIGFHIGEEWMEVDFDVPLSWEQVLSLEARANEVIWENLPVKCWIPSPEELEKVTYRCKRRLDWPVRIVEVGGVDCCACCGVHTATTGQVGYLKIISAAKFHGGTRLEMVCGGRACRYMGAIFAQNRQISQTLSAKMPETAAAVETLSDALAAEKLRGNSLQRQVFEHIAESYVNCKKAVHFTDALSGGDLRLLATLISQRCGGPAAVFAGSDGAYSYCLAHPGGDLRKLGKALNEAFSGRGGGKPEFQQGSLSGTKAEILAFFQK